MGQRDGDKSELFFISGGVRSGKSSYAEQLATSYAKQLGASLYYIATSMADDDEMEERISRHQNNRKVGGYNWQTFEIERNLAEKIVNLRIDGVVLLDCLTVLTANELFVNQVDRANLTNMSAQVKQNILNGLATLRKKARMVIVVSNEIHHEYNDNEYVQAYQKLLGQLHQEVVKESTVSYLVEGGIPLRMK